MAGFTSLPREILLLIAGNLIYPYLKSVAQTCKTIYRILEPCLYNSVSFKSLTERYKFEDFLQSRPELASSVKAIKFDYRGGSGLPRSNDEGEAAFCSRLPNLRSIYLFTNIWQPSGWQQVAERSLMQNHGSFLHLRSGKSETNLPEATMESWGRIKAPSSLDDTGVVYLLNLPSLRSLILMNYELDYDYNFNQEQSLEYLGLIECALMEDSMKKLLDARRTDRLRLYNPTYITVDGTGNDVHFESNLLLRSIARSQACHGITSLALERDVMFRERQEHTPFDFSPFSSLADLFINSEKLMQALNWHPSQTSINISSLPRTLHCLRVRRPDPRRYSTIVCFDFLGLVLDHIKSACPDFTDLVCQSYDNSRDYDIDALLKDLQKRAEENDIKLWQGTRSYLFLDSFSYFGSVVD